ncbi:MAG TPA: DUF502 domain-containing protein [Planctomycetota bacterium]|nr:DUF502 domain-containing protein [Planctomycetota bacterium]
MESPTRHITRCTVAGIVALLPLGGVALTIVWLENAISGSWKASLPYYFPGLGILLALLLIYLVGLFVTTFAGRWLWRRTDQLLERLPLLGSLYQSLKEVLGYDSSRAHFFRGVVAVASHGGHQLGLVTGECRGPDGSDCMLVFVPGSPNPTSGRLLLLPAHQLAHLDVKVADALRALVSMGKTPLQAATP